MGRRLEEEGREVSGKARNRKTHRQAENIYMEDSMQERGLRNQMRPR